MKTFFVLSVLFAVALAGFTESDYQDAFRQFMHTHKKSYHHDEFKTKYSVFKANMNFIDAQNKKGLTYTVAMNKFGDMTKEEFGKYYLGLKKVATPATNLVATPKDPSLPSSLDWRTKGAVTAVKDQGQCGSCWSFSTTGSTEGCHFLTTGSLVSLSEQNLVDCSGAQGNQGCDGGLMTAAMDYIISNNGLDTEATYPYTAEDGTCQFNPANVGATLKSYINVNQGDENDLQSKVNMGPTSVAIDASQDSFQFYQSGVYYEPACSSDSLDHGVLAVGWGTDSTGGDYWIVKNSWAATWGLDGYIWMSRNKNNNCGIATMATLPQC